ncbi:MAG: cytochrome c oxidase subunit 3 [Chloroflexi bacterium]|nr:cytochrome c oxidase subunit 3 [Chloroflexota bacterium]MCI0580122.1 cytochrome c oxidase subunit 3 [Chloroflexota bacterium]MCI0649302.1 cytochrome c oxidase subunit 3 [Chloroflexota bacterium]MCI0725965.1 cytochrome c oxidase subunit 3 [Chloroflexota bacterium]
MSAVVKDLPAHHGHEPSYELQLRNNRLALWLFCFSEIFLFGALLSSRFYLWGNTRPDLDQTLGLITTSVLLLSSFFMARAETAIGHDDRPVFMRSLLLTAGLGILFLVGVVGLEWGGHLRPDDGVYGAIFFGMTGVHALHVLSGVILILIAWNNGRRGHYSAGRHWGVEACAIYWHYVDVVWVFFYPALYLIGTVADI